MLNYLNGVNIKLFIKENIANNQHLDQKNNDYKLLIIYK
jgi:hypothetical protein